MSYPNPGHFQPARHEATTPEPVCTCGAAIGCSLSDHTINCAITLDLYARHILAVARTRQCRHCDLFTGYGAVGIIRAPQAHERDPDWLGSHCWSCEQPVENICPACGRYLVAPFGWSGRLCDGEGTPDYWQDVL